MTTEEEKLQAAAAQLKKELMPFVGKPNTKKVRRQIVDHLLNTLVTDGLLSSTEAPTLTPTLTVGQIIKRLGPLAPNAATAKE